MMDGVFKRRAASTSSLEPSFDSETIPVRLWNLNKLVNCFPPPGAPRPLPPTKEQTKSRSQELFDKNQEVLLTWTKLVLLVDLCTALSDPTSFVFPTGGSFQTSKLAVSWSRLEQHPQ
ncbi:hypothetical protein AMECASPLE_016714 [Ameca splendens]|uniref:Uncharacterized protein n=1 Tax=Ameca splendens TaxID=208324 RepID=A0ABV0ZM24_9TELE